MKKSEQKNNNDELAAVFLLGLVGLSVWNSKEDIWNWFLKQIDPYVEIAVTIVTILVVGLVLWFLLPWITEFLFYFRRLKQMKTKRIILSRDDTTEPFEIMKFLDAVNGMLHAKFPIYGHFIGFDHMVWELGSENGQKYIEVSAPGFILDEICGSLQSVYQNIRFRTVSTVKEKQLPEDYLQLRLERHWFYGLQTLRNYQKVMAESIFAAIDKSHGDAGVQIVMTPVAQGKQRRMRKTHEKFEKKHQKRGTDDLGLGKTAQKELQSAFENRGKGFFICEVRVWADSHDARRAVVGSLQESSAENKLVSERLVNYWIRRLFKRLWWWWVQHRMPAIGLGPKIKLSSFQLATLVQLPTMRLRVTGLERSSTRRVPVPDGVYREESQAFVEDEDGEPVAIEKAMRYLNALFLGMHGTGKTTALTHYAGPVLADKSRAAIIVTPDRGDAEKYLGYIPPEKPVYIIDLSRPGEYGLNILSDDSLPADQLAGNLLSAFRTAYGRDAIGDQSADFLQQPLYALRRVREESPEWKKVIPILDFRHLRRMLVDDQFREQVTLSLPEDSSSFDYWGRQIPKLLETKNFYNQRIAPILNKFNALLTSERVEAILCHPNPITLRKVIDERGVVLLYNAKNEVGEETANLFSNMLMSMVFQAVSSQVDKPESERVEVDLILDEIHGYANNAVRTLLQESRKYGARTAAATLSINDLPMDIRKTFKNLFGHKIIFRLNDVAEADEFSKSFAQLHSNMVTVSDEVQDRIRIGVEDIRDLERFSAFAQLTVDDKVMPAFKVRTRSTDPHANEEWKQSHPWPSGETKHRPHPIDLSQLTKSPEQMEKEAAATKEEAKEIDQTSASWPVVGDLPPREVQEICETEEMQLEEARPILKKVDQMIKRMKLSGQGIRSQPALLRSQLQKIKKEEEKANAGKSK